ncbi:MAG TPA: DGQHR domain-containing protein [Ruminococcus sp.]|nr:DGQHR domain-containing protein [Ruminococcus sp.]
MILPVIRGRIGIWRFYSGVMTFRQIKEKVSPSINELYHAKCIDELLQRDLTENYKSIKDYLLNDKERFFNAIILAIYNGDPQWLEIEFENDDNSNVGFLQFNGDEVIFPVDGQHRVAGIINAINEKPDLEDENVPVIFIAHKTNDEGRARTRKLFSTLNRRAKPVGANENIALDEDDVCAIITRDLVQNHELFYNDNVVNVKSKQIPNNNKEALTSLIALYQCVCEYVQVDLNLKSTKFKEYLLYRPEEVEINRLKNGVFGFFDSMMNNTNVLKEYVLCNEKDKAGKFRNNMGGNILFRPIIITDYISICVKLQRHLAVSFDEVFRIMNKMPSDLNQRPWLHFLWDGERIINRLSHSLIKNLMQYMTCSAMLSEKEENALIKGYAKSLTIPETEANNILLEYKDYCSIE